MGEYIDRQKAVVELREEMHADTDYMSDLICVGIADVLNKLPSADVVEVVRCGECKHMTEDGRCLEFADDCLRPSASDYCSYGERKE